MKLTKKQNKQEEQYVFPYHYADLHKGFWLMPSSIIEYKSIIKAIQKRLPKNKSAIILDAGCGDGRFIYETKKKYKYIEGLDYSGNAISFAITFNPYNTFWVKDLEYLNVIERFDTIVFSGTLEHIKPSKVNNVLYNLKIALKKSGKLIITVPSTNIKLSEKHYTHYTKEMLEQLLGKYFVVESVTGLGRLGLKMKLFQLTYLIPQHPIIGKWIRLDKFYNLMERFFLKHLAEGEPSKCKELLVVCKREV